MRSIVLGAAVLAASAATGCTTIGLAGYTNLGSTGYVYQAGTASQGFAFTGMQVQAAVIEAMNDLGIRVQRQAHDATTVTYECKTLDGRRATIGINSQTSLPIVSARVGLLGDEPLSKALLSRVGIRLGSLPPEAIPAEPPSAPESWSYYSPGRTPPAPALRNQSDLGYRDTSVP
jgi:uncharacterized protein DUF3568